MKNLLVVLFCTLAVATTSAQKIEPVTISGNWIANLYRDTIRLSFVDANYGMIQWNTWSKTKSAFQYKMIARGSNVLLTISPFDNMRKDSLMFVMVKTSKKEYELKNIVRKYTDGRPPELELSDNASYVLKKEDN